MSALSMEVFWLFVLAVMIILELITLGLTTIWFGGGALVAALSAVLGASVPVQIILFVVTSVLFMALMRPYAMKFFNISRTKTNINAVLGQTARVTQKIDNINEEGEVYLNGLVWMARTEDGQIAEVGEMVTVKSVSGVKLMVTR